MTPARQSTAPAEEEQERRFLGLTRRQRIRLYGLGGLCVLLVFLVWSWIYLQPTRWAKHTDQVAFEQVARDVEPGYVAWEPGSPDKSIVPVENEDVRAPAISSNGARMVYSSTTDGGNADLFLRRWNGSTWGAPKPLRALNSAFHETAPCLSGDGQFLFFASDRPGGRGGHDIWVARWDGLDYAWPLPLTGRVNTPFDETDPALTPDGSRLYFASNRPYISEAQVIKAEAKNEILAEVDDLKDDFDLYAAETAGETLFDLIVERQLSMLYSLREGALADPEVMKKLGGSRQTESAVDRGLEYLAHTQEEDGRWDIRKSGGQGGHDQAATAFALLAFYGRGERHDRECRYREVVERGLRWLLTQQDRASGDLRGARPAHNAMYDHGIASLALVEAYGVTKDPDLRPRVVAALEFMGESQHEQGGWRYRPGERGDLSVTGWYIMALVSARMSGIAVPDKIHDGAVAFLRRMQGGKAGGSFGYTDSPGKRDSRRPGMNAAGFFCSQLIGDSPETPAAWESMGILADSGLKHNDLYYIYYGTIAVYQAQGPLWRAWRTRMQETFLQSQRKDGSWNPGGGHGSAMGRVIGTSLTVLCLEAHYRYTPIYGLGAEPHPDGPRSGGLTQDQLPATPLFRHARYLEELNSPEHDTGPVVTEHADFLYFASSRPGGFGGSDLYRSRISGPAPTPPENLGPAINSAGDETEPAVRMAGFHLIYHAGRDGEPAGLFTSKSRRLEQRYDYTRLPTFGFLLRNLHWVLLLVLSLCAGVFLTRRALAHSRRPARGGTEPGDHEPALS